MLQIIAYSVDIVDSLSSLSCPDCRALAIILPPPLSTGTIGGCHGDLMILISPFPPPPPPPHSLQLLVFCFGFFFFWDTVLRNSG